MPPNEIPTRVQDGRQQREPEIVPCNFRSAGRLSNESTRHLRTMHEAFARNLSHSLDLFLGSPLELKLAGVEQVGAREFVSSLNSGAYLVPYTLLPSQSRIIVKFDHVLLFPLLDVLLGGSGEPADITRELTDIDEELIRSVTELIGVQLERTWKGCNVSVMPSASLRPALAGQIFLAEERVISLHFEVALGGTSAGIRIVLPMAFCNALIRSCQSESTHRIPGDPKPSRPLRDRVLDCTMSLSAELPLLAISVGEVIAMSPGSIVNLHVPVETPVQLRIGSYPFFEVTPVRKGTRKAAQLLKPFPNRLETDQ